MKKNTNKKLKQKKGSPEVKFIHRHTSENRNVKIELSDQNKIKKQLGLIVLVFAFGLYANSVQNNYVLDDISVIKQNKIVTQGIKGIPSLMLTDYWYGFIDGVRVPQYRPVSLIMFALEWQFFPGNPHISHFINVFIYAITCLLLFNLLCRLFENKNLFLPFLCIILYTAHPIHTEIVNNIKSRDELLCFLFGIVSIMFFFNFYSKKSSSSFILGGLTYFITLISKETGIAFLLLIPLCIFFFKDTNIKRLSGIFLTLTIVSGIYFAIRSSVISNIQVVQHFQLIDNSLMGSANYFSQFATAISILLQYIFLLAFPNPLSYDYSYAQIPIQTISSPQSIIALIIFLVLAIYAVIGIRKKNIFSFSILLFLISAAPVSNIFVLIGSTKAERFMYIPSLAFCIAVSAIIIKIFKINPGYTGIKNLKKFFSSNVPVLFLILLISVIYSFKVFGRNRNWKDNFTLFSTDIKNADKSARAHYNLGSALIYDKYKSETNPEVKQGILMQARSEFEKAASILPTYHDVNKELGYLYLVNNEFDKAIVQADEYLKIDKTKSYAYDIKGCSLFGLKKYDEALLCFQKAIALNASDTAAYKNSGRSFAYLGKYKKAIEYFNKGIELDSTDSENYLYIGLSYQFMGDSAQVKSFMEKAEKIKNLK